MRQSRQANGRLKLLLILKAKSSEEEGRTTKTKPSVFISKSTSKDAPAPASVASCHSASALETVQVAHCTLEHGLLKVSHEIATERQHLDFFFFFWLYSSGLVSVNLEK